MKYLIQLLVNTLSLIGAIFLNYWVNTPNATSSTIGEISKKYDALIVPAPYAFSIWGIIYLMLIVFTIYQWKEWIKHRNKELLDGVGYWFFISNCANGLWTYVWLEEYTMLSVVIMLVLLLSLIKMAINLKLELWDAPMPTIAWVWWPITIYLGWIVLATVANISSALISIGWRGAPLTETSWTILLIGIATIIYLILIRARNMREAALVGIWGLSALAVKQYQLNSTVAYVAISGCVILFLAVCHHAYQNRNTLPFVSR